MLGSLEGTFRANLGPFTLNWKQSTLVSIQVGYLWQMPFRSWGNHTCMDGHRYELSRAPVRTSNHVIREKNHVVPTSWQDEALARDRVSREVPCSPLIGMQA